MGNRLRNTSCTLSSGSAWVHPRPPPAPRKRSLREHQGTTRGCSFFIFILIIIIIFFFFFIIIITIFFIITVHHNGHILSSSSSSSSSLSWCQHVVKSAAVATTMQRPLMRGLILDMVDLHGDGPSWKSETTPQTPNSYCSVCALAIFDPCQVSTAWITSNIFSCHGVSIFWDAMCILSETIRGRQGWETSGEMPKKHCGTWFYLQTTRRRKGIERTETNTKHKWKHDEDIWLVRDNWWKTHKCEQAKEPDTTTNPDWWLETSQKTETDKWETPCERHMIHDERQVKAKKDTSESRTPLGKAGDKWRETSKKTSKETDTTSQTGKQRKGDKVKTADWETNEERQVKRNIQRAGHPHLERGGHLLRENWEPQQ